MKDRVIHSSLDLLDRQIVDRDDELVGKVDDVEFEQSEAGALRLTALLLGPQVYGQRLGGRLGRWIASTATRLAGTSEPIRIPVELIDDIDVAVKLKVPIGNLERVERVEEWLRQNLIGRIPGADSASE